MDPEPREEGEAKTPEIEPTELPEPPEWDWEREKSRLVQPKKSAPDGKPVVPDASRSLGIAVAVGYSFVGPVVAGVILGLLLDGGRPGTWTVIGVLAGTIAAFVLLIRLVSKLNEDQK